MGRWLGVALSLAGVGLIALGLAVSVDQGWIYPNNPSHEAFPVRGLDVSHHQGPIDWPAVARTGRFRFVWIKATEGGDWTDPRFQENWTGARAAGLEAGAYHYFTLCRPGREQALHFLATVPMSEGTLPPAVDLEHEGNCRQGRPDHAQIQREIADFLTAVRAATGIAPVIYTTRAFYKDHLRGQLGDHSLWLRDVFVRPPAMDGHAWTFWQYRSRGKVEGIDAFVDENLFVGDERAYEAFLTRGALTRVGPHSPSD